MKKLLVLAAALAFVFVLASTASDSSPRAEDPAPGEDHQVESAYLITFCPPTQPCEADSKCHKDQQCTLSSDTGVNSCRIGPGSNFSCPSGQTVWVETCSCTGKGCRVSTGTYLTCS